MSYNVERAFGYYDEPVVDENLLDESVERFRDLARFIIDYFPANRERALALTNLEQAWSWVDGSASSVGVE
ncbi:hypothetical protein [Mycobacterium intracellulare]|uniref:Acb2/Tad1 hairpin domain-containing protein n=1 Tax=Mycobacterium intracellulare TaxID=1767 RepID=A0AAE4R865_MYCIT|nr:hypothetical protein [Mycobacterium intracellulare]MDV6975287.1 hypothetical protein [Mycobacterium intracellulare]MDV6980351.1 hypothetical protein [Mycobacterium intracellulare]MDV7010780.1 hypothetical protein [Mycobacterium intracellulare]MDV7025686.1 hypothetical protein [Mycobacterium intracellulare]